MADSNPTLPTFSSSFPMSQTKHLSFPFAASVSPASFTVMSSWFRSSCLAALVIVSVAGCGSKDSEMAANSSLKSNSSATAMGENTENVAAPADVVSQYLDLVRRGGVDTGAGSLLTSRAQAELKRIGIAVTPIGSPDAKFTVTRSEAFPEQPNSMLVHTIWSEPGADGTPTNTEVVWALEREPAGWRISGLAMDQGGPEGPQFIDFENGARMAQLMNEVSPQPESQQAIAR
ncbi:MAG: hypothetical protein WBD31_31450 [Rubripirellula sp.]